MTMYLFRVCDDAFRHSPFSGRGAYENGGRWNSIGKPAVYTSATLYGALMEYMPYIVDRRSLLTKAMWRTSIDDADIESVNLDDLPDTWNSISKEYAAAPYGDAWLDSKRSLALKVPSAAVYGEFCYLVNPLHPDFDKVSDGALQVPIIHDPRLPIPEGSLKTSKKSVAKKKVIRKRSSKKKKK
jgi:RES domain-containing protein